LAQALTAGAKPTQLPVRFRVSEQTLEGAVGNIYGDVRVSVQFARLSGRALLLAWIEHLAWSLQAEACGLKASSSWLIGRHDGESEPQIVVWRAESRPGLYLECLTTLLQVFHLGCQSPIPLFPDISCAYQQRQRDPKKKDIALDNDWARQMEQDVSLRRVYGPHSRLTPHQPMLQLLDARVPSFHALAERVFEPLIAHWERPAFQELLGAAGETRAEL
jgi:exonuclease V gamma subunit